MVDFEHGRRAMVNNQLRTSNVTDRRLLTAMLEVPREDFLPADRKALAYIDEAHQLAGGRALSAPAPFAKLVQLAEIEATDTVLDIGAGSGYSTAVLARLAAEVVGVESNAGLAEQGAAMLKALGIANARLVQAPIDSPPVAAPGYGVIVIEGAVDSVPPALLSLLRDGGRLVALIRKGPTAVANVFVRSGASINSRAEFNASLPSLSTEKKGEAFVF